MGKTALVTGGSRGIGRAVARELASKGYQIVITCVHSEEQLYLVKKEIKRDFGVMCEAVVCDMGEYEAVKELFGKIPPPDVIVNNAGISFVGLLSDMSDEDWQRVMQVNLSSCFYTSKLAIPHMLKAGGGHIVNLSSVWGSVGASMEVAYSASKGGVNAFTRALAKELAPSGIRVNAIACGLIDTDMNAGLTEEDREALIREIPADRIGTAKEVASLVGQLTESPGYLTGQIITIDGGWL